MGPSPSPSSSPSTPSIALPVQVQCTTKNVTSKTNIALGKPVTMSSLWRENTIGSLATDGDLSSNAGLDQCAVTDWGNPSWITVDLTTVQEIDSIFLQSRTDCCLYRFGTWIVSVGNTPEESRTENIVYHLGQPSSPDCFFKMPVTARGRYVTFKQSGFAEICQFEVYVDDE